MRFSRQALFISQIMFRENFRHHGSPTTAVDDFCTTYLVFVPSKEVYQKRSYLHVILCLDTLSISSHTTY